jgi:hypothetical protein
MFRLSHHHFLPFFVSCSNSIASELLPNSVQDPLIYDESKQDPTVVMSQVPAWVAYDRKVLRFYAYFTESVPQSPIETERVRRMIIYFYLEDDSIHVAEQKSENSGLPQVFFLNLFLMFILSDFSSFFRPNFLFFSFPVCVLVTFQRPTF